MVLWLLLIHVVAVLLVGGSSYDSDVLDTDVVVAVVDHRSCFPIVMVLLVV